MTTIESKWRKGREEEERRKQVRIRMKGSVAECSSLLNRGDRVGLIEKVTYKQRLEGGERASHVDIQEKSILRKRPKGAT